MITGRDIVITGLQSWEGDLGSNCVNIAREFAKNNRVLYVNYPLNRLVAFREKASPSVQKRINVIKGKEEDLQNACSNLWVLTPGCILESISQLKPNFLFDLINKMNNKRFAKQIKSAIDRLGFKDIILFNDNDIYRSFYLDELLDPSIYAYYLRDNMVSVKYWARHGERIQSKLMKKTDLVVANSTYLRDMGLKQNPQSYYVGQGCDFTLYQDKDSLQKPRDIQDIPHPIIGYIGAVWSLRLDIDSIRNLAIKKPEWNIVLIGPEDDIFKASDLHLFRNIHFIGKRKQEELASYLKYFDVAINPQLLSPETIGNYPRKIDEYLAMGKPVVARKTDAMEIFSEYCYLAESNDEFLALTEKALDENSKEKESKRKAFAYSHTWENSVAEIYKAIEMNTSFKKETLKA
ncbi:MAG: glycosyltransferase [Bacteroidota bacterium]|nr:glycosyltransferase [Bacteroidota bacterium]